MCWWRWKVSGSLASRVLTSPNSCITRSSWEVFMTHSLFQRNLPNRILQLLNTRPRDATLPMFVYFICLHHCSHLTSVKLCSVYFWTTKHHYFFTDSWITCRLLLVWSRVAWWSCHSRPGNGHSKLHCWQGTRVAPVGEAEDISPSQLSMMDDQIPVAAAST